jgi:hypothetical protein
MQIQTLTSQDLGFTAYGREPQAIKAGEVYVDEDHMTLQLQPV